MAHRRCDRRVLIQNKHSRWWGAALTPQRRCRTFSTRMSEGGCAEASKLRIARSGAASSFDSCAAALFSNGPARAPGSWLLAPGPWILLRYMRRILDPAPPSEF